MTADQIILHTTKAALQQAQEHNYQTKTVECNGQLFTYYQCPLSFTWHPNLLNAQTAYFSKLMAQQYRQFIELSSKKAC